MSSCIFVLDSGIVDQHDLVDRTLDLSAEADNSPIIVPRLKMITHKQVGFSVHFGHP